MAIKKYILIIQNNFAAVNHDYLGCICLVLINFQVIQTRYNKCK